MLHENIHAKTFAQMDSACADQFRSFVIDQQHFKYEANTSAFLKDLKFSIKLLPWSQRFFLNFPRVREPRSGECELRSGEKEKTSGYLGPESHFHADAGVMI